MSKGNPRVAQLRLLGADETRVVNIRLEPGWTTDRRYVFIGRRSGVDPATLRPGSLGSFGNPFMRPVVGAEAIPMFEKYARERIVAEQAYRRAVRWLDGKILGCYCVTIDGRGKCHGNVYLKLIDELKAGKL